MANQSGATWIGNALNGAGGTLGNAGTWTGTVSNAGTFVNAAGGTVSGGLTNTAGITANSGIIQVPPLVSGGALTGTGSVGALTVTSGGTLAAGNGTRGLVDDGDRQPRVSVRRLLHGAAQSGDVELSPM